MASPKSTQQLYETYPCLFPKNIIDCKSGWVLLIDQMCAAIQVYLDNTDLFGEEKKIEFEFTKIKELHGVLFIEYNGGDEVVKIIVDRCKQMSYRICEFCGEAGELYCSSKHRAWSHYKTLCLDHAIALFYYRLYNSKKGVI